MKPFVVFLALICSSLTARADSVPTDTFIATTSEFGTLSWTVPASPIPDFAVPPPDNSFKLDNVSLSQTTTVGNMTIVEDLLFFPPTTLQALGLVSTISFEGFPLGGADLNFDGSIWSGLSNHPTFILGTFTNNLGETLTITASEPVSTPESATFAFLLLGLMMVLLVGNSLRRGDAKSVATVCLSTQDPLRHFQPIGNSRFRLTLAGAPCREDPLNATGNTRLLSDSE